jgi:hypothetical protein
MEDIKQREFQRYFHRHKGGVWRIIDENGEVVGRYGAEGKATVIDLGGNGGRVGVKVGNDVGVSTTVMDEEMSDVVAESYECGQCGNSVSEVTMAYDFDLGEEKPCCRGCAKRRGLRFIPKL